MQIWADRPVQKEGDICALYLGGGTPSALSSANLSRILKAAHNYLPLAADCEITLEGRMHDMTTERLDATVKGGVNRVSLGVQTFNEYVQMRSSELCEFFPSMANRTQVAHASAQDSLFLGIPHE